MLNASKDFGICTGSIIHNLSMFDKKNGHKIKGAKKPVLQLSTALACYNWNIDCDNQYLHYSIGPSIGLLLDYWLLALQYTGTLHCTALGR